MDEVFYRVGVRLAVFLQMKPRCLCFLLLNLSQDREGKTIKMPTFIEPLLCAGCNAWQHTGMASLAHPKKTLLSLFSNEETGPREVTKTAYGTYQKMWELSQYLSNFVAHCFFLPLCLAAEKRILSPVVTLHQYSTIPQTCMY